MVFLVVTLVVAAIIFAAVYTAYRSRPIVVSSFGPSDPLSNYRAAVSPASAALRAAARPGVRHYRRARRPGLVVDGADVPAR